MILKIIWDNIDNLKKIIIVFKKTIGINIGQIDRASLKFMTLNLVSRIMLAFAQLYAITIIFRSEER